MTKVVVPAEGFTSSREYTGASEGCAQHRRRPTSGRCPGPGDGLNHGLIGGHQGDDGDRGREGQHHAVHQEELPYLGDEADETSCCTPNSTPPAAKRSLRAPKDVAEASAEGRSEGTDQIVARQREPQ